MPRVKMDVVTEGMTVAAEVKNMDDMLLIPAGCVLTARHINILRTWGISEIVTEGDEQVASDMIAVSPEVLERVERELKGHYWQYDPDAPAQREIFELALRRKSRAAMEEGKHAA